MHAGGKYQKPLQYPVHFVVPDNLVWPELLKDPSGEIAQHILEKRCVGSLNGWLVRTYYELKRRGDNPSMSSSLDDAAINVVSPRDFGRRQRDKKSFILWPRADGHAPMMANFTVVQNTGYSERGHVGCIPYWPQPAIRPRSAERTGLSIISFKGRRINLHPVFQTDGFRSKLSNLGVQFDVDAFDGLLGAHDWGDYRSVDAVLAARPLTVRDAIHKPASKLINAWFGDVPAILGPEPAYRALRQSSLDYIEIQSEAEALDAILRLKQNPDLYQAMVENGQNRRTEFSSPKVADRWVQLLNERVGPAFKRWHARPEFSKFLSYAGMMAAEPISRRFYQYYIRNGRRIM